MTILVFLLQLCQLVVVSLSIAVYHNNIEYQDNLVRIL